MHALKDIIKLCFIPNNTGTHFFVFSFSRKRESSQHEGKVYIRSRRNRKTHECNSFFYDSEFSKELTFKNLIYICICQPPPGKPGNKHRRDSKHLPWPQNIFGCSYISTINYHSCKMNHWIQWQVLCYILSRTSAPEIKYKPRI